jgi:CDP-glucose 4,6-dehydratase
VDDVGALKPNAAFWAGKRVFLTGHTGFKGGWLSLWLHELGAIVAGYALAPETTPNFFSVCDVASVLQHRIGDVRDAATLTAAMAAFEPEIVFHLAAQPLVRASYAMPVETFATNIMGTVNLLDAARKMPSIAVVIIVTSDKVYASTDIRHDETSRLGGQDPYSASKACAELVTASFPMPGQNIASVRSGNVIGGGDWAAERLLPDFFRSVFVGHAWKIRNPHAIRPWQHVLDPLCGYLLAAEFLSAKKPAHREIWNFGPEAESEVAVCEIAMRLCALWGEDATYHVEPQQNAPHEAAVLRLESAKAKRELGWQPGWDLDQALGATADWFRAYHAAKNMTAFTQMQIKAYCKP